MWNLIFSLVIWTRHLCFIQAIRNLYYEDLRNILRLSIQRWLFLFENKHSSLFRVLWHFLAFPFQQKKLKLGQNLSVKGLLSKVIKFIINNFKIRNIFSLKNLIGSVLDNILIGFMKHDAIKHYWFQ